VLPADGKLSTWQSRRDLPELQLRLKRLPRRLHQQLELVVLRLERAS